MLARRIAWLCLFVSFLSGAFARASVFGQVQGVVHDPQHRPIQGAQVMLHAAHADLSFNATSDHDGSFRFSAVPLGLYVLTISDPGFTSIQETVTVASGLSDLLHLQLEVGAVTQSTTVFTQPETIQPD